MPLKGRGIYSAEIAIKLSQKDQNTYMYSAGMNLS